MHDVRSPSLSLLCNGKLRPFNTCPHRLTPPLTHTKHERRAQSVLLSLTFTHGVYHIYSMSHGTNTYLHTQTHNDSGTHTDKRHHTHTYTVRLSHLRTHAMSHTHDHVKTHPHNVFLTHKYQHSETCMQCHTRTNKHVYTST